MKIFFRCAAMAALLFSIGIARAHSQQEDCTYGLVQLDTSPRVAKDRIPWAREQRKIDEQLRRYFVPLLHLLKDRVRRLGPEEVAQRIRGIEQENQISPPISYDDSKAEGAFSGFAARLFPIFQELRTELVYEAEERHRGHSVPTRQHARYLMRLPAGLDHPEWRLVMGTLKSSNESTLMDFVFPSLTPIGGYGVPMARSLLITTVLVRQLISEIMPDDIEFQSPEDHELINRHTFMGAQFGSKGPLLTMLESVNTTAQTIALLVPERLADRSYREVISSLLHPLPSHKMNSLFSAFSARVPFGVVASHALAGWYFADPLSFDRESPRIPAEVAKAMKVRRERQLIELTKVYDRCGHIPPEQTAMGCPFSQPTETHPHTGIQEMAEAFLPVFNLVDDALTSRSRTIEPEKK